MLGKENCSVIIVAGGSGQRMGGALPKQYLLLAGKPVIYHTVAAFFNTLPASKIIVVVAENYREQVAGMLQDFSQKLTIVAGGSNRFESVKCGLAEVESGIVLVHDAVRPLADVALIRRCAEACLTHGNAIPCVLPVDSLRHMNEAGTFAVLDRDAVRCIQTPQAFAVAALKAAFAAPWQESFTDEASVLEANGGKLHLVDGSYHNIKITHPADLIIAEALLRHLAKN